MEVKIFTTELLNSCGRGQRTRLEDQQGAVEVLQRQVNEHLSMFRDRQVQVEWIQTSAANKYDAFTQVTAIVTTL